MDSYAMIASKSENFFSSFKHHCKSVVRVSVILQLIRSSFCVYNVWKESIILMYFLCRFE